MPEIRCHCRKSPRRGMWGALESENVFSSSHHCRMGWDWECRGVLGEPGNVGCSTVCSPTTRASSDSQCLRQLLVKWGISSMGTTPNSDWAKHPESNTLCTKISHFNRQRNASKTVLLNVESSYIHFFLKLHKRGNESRFCNTLSYRLKIDGWGKVKKQKTKW